MCREYLEIPEERCGIKIDIFVVENTYDNAFLRRLHGMRVEAGLLLLSCYRMYLWRNEFYKLSRGNKKAATMIHLKSFIGRLIAPTGKFWYAHVQRLMQMCSNDQSEYIVVPSGRKHFFGELKLRSDFYVRKSGNLRITNFFSQKH